MQIISLIKKIARELDRFNIPYMIIGGQAAILHGEPRFTDDIDITLGVDTVQSAVIMNLVDNLNFKILVANPIEFVYDSMVLPVIDEKSQFRVDFIFSFTEYEKNAIERAVKVDLEGVTVRYCSAEDLIIHKMLAYRERDLEDIRKILIKNKNLDMELIYKELAELSLSLDLNLVENFKRLQ